MRLSSHDAVHAADMTYKASSHSSACISWNTVRHQFHMSLIVKASSGRALLCTDIEPVQHCRCSKLHKQRLRKTDGHTKTEITLYTTSTQYRRGLQRRYPHKIFCCNWHTCVCVATKIHQTIFRNKATSFTHLQRQSWVLTRNQFSQGTCTPRTNGLLFHHLA